LQNPAKYINLPLRPSGGMADAGDLKSQNTLLPHTKNHILAVKRVVSGMVKLDEVGPI